MIRADVRLEDGPMRPVTCAACGAEVTARKSSPDQTSVQWTADAVRRCHERSVVRPSSDRPNRQAFAGCSALRDAVRSVVTHRFPAADFTEAFETVRAGECGKVILDWEQSGSR